MLMGRALRQRQSAADQGPLSRLREARGSHAHGNDSPLLPRPSTGSKPVLGRGRVRKPGAQTHSQGLELAQAQPTWDPPVTERPVAPHGQLLAHSCPPSSQVRQGGPTMTPLQAGNSDITLGQSTQCQANDQGPSLA